MSQGRGSFVVTNTGTGVISGAVAMVPGTAVAYFDGTHGSRPLGPGESTPPAPVMEPPPAGVKWGYTFTREGRSYAGEQKCSYTPGAIPVQISLGDGEIIVLQSTGDYCTGGLKTTAALEAAASV